MYLDKNGPYYYLRRKGRKKIYLGKLPVHRRKPFLLLEQAYDLSEQHDIPLKEFYAVNGLEITAPRGTDLIVPQGIISDTADYTVEKMKKNADRQEYWSIFVDTINDFVEKEHGSNERTATFALSIHSIISHLEALRTKAPSLPPDKILAKGIVMDEHFKTFNELIEDCGISFKLFIKASYLTEGIPTLLQFDMPSFVGICPAV